MGDVWYRLPRPRSLLSPVAWNDKSVQYLFGEHFNWITWMTHLYPPPPSCFPSNLQNYHLALSCSGERFGPKQSVRPRVCRCTRTTCHEWGKKRKKEFPLYVSGAFYLFNRLLCCIVLFKPKFLLWKYKTDAGCSGWKRRDERFCMRAECQRFFVCVCVCVCVGHQCTFPCFSKGIYYRMCFMLCIRGPRQKGKAYKHQQEKKRKKTNCTH